MARKKFWNGFATGAAVGAVAGVGSWLVSRVARRQQQENVVRIEKSLQIGKPIEEVFRAWSSLEQLPDYLRNVEEVRSFGNRSRWRVRIGGKLLEWDAELTQRIENQALGWKSVRGPKHTGRVNFSPLGNDTQIHVVANYKPRLGILGRRLAQASSALDHHLEQALRDFKAALEGKGQERQPMMTSRLATPGMERATGTHGLEGSTGVQTSRYGGIPSPGDYTRPPAAKS